jgi:hypothetical protein
MSAPQWHRLGRVDDLKTKPLQQIQAGEVVLALSYREMTFPLALAAAIGLEPGDEVQWELLDRRELHLVRLTTRQPAAKSKAKK